MSLDASALAHVLLALSALLLAAHAGGSLFARLRQPPVIGEILGGLLLGPTLLGQLLPGLQRWIFASNPATAPILGAVYQCGLLLLMYCSGSELRASYRRGERSTVALVTLFGTVVPFALGLLFLRWIDAESLMGPARSPAALILVFAIAIAVTSIPVISRILFDLGILDTDFSRIVLTVAVIEDVVLYVALALAIAIAGGKAGGASGLPRLLGLASASGGGLAYYALVTLGFVSASLAFGPEAFRVIEGHGANFIRKRSPLAHMLVFLMAMTGAAVFLGIPAMFGALMAGIVGSGPAGEGAPARDTVKAFAFGVFIPAYFAIVGLKLDLIRSFDPGFFLLFAGFACAVKAASVYAGATLAGQGRLGAFNLAAAMNARGGPGIVLASLAYDAGIVNPSFYVSLVLLAIVTSLLAGTWLEFVVRRGLPLLSAREGRATPSRIGSPAAATR